MIQTTLHLVLLDNNSRFYLKWFNIHYAQVIEYAWCLFFFECLYKKKGGENMIIVYETQHHEAIKIMKALK